MIMFGFSQNTAKINRWPHPDPPGKMSSLNHYLEVWRPNAPKKSDAAMPTMPVFRAQNSFHQLSVRSKWKFPPLKKNTAPKKPERFWDANFSQKKSPIFFGAMDCSELQSPVGFLGWSSTDPGDPDRFLKKHDPGIEEMCLDYSWCPKISLIIVCIYIVYINKVLTLHPKTEPESTENTRKTQNLNSTSNS